MGTDEDVVGFGEPHGLIHDRKVPAPSSLSYLLKKGRKDTDDAWNPQATLARWIVFMRASSSPYGRYHKHWWVVEAYIY